MKAFVEAAKSKAANHYGEGMRADDFLFGADFGIDWCFENLVAHTPEECKKILEKDGLLEVIRRWKFGWMDVKGTDEADRKNYFNRAFGIDANMSHGLASLLSKELIPVLSLIVRQQQRIQELENVPHGTIRIPHMGSVK